MPNYRSNTSTTDPHAAAAHVYIPPSDIQTIRNRLNDGIAILSAFQPQGNEEERGKQRLLGIGAQISFNIDAAEQNPATFQGLAQELSTWRRGIFNLTQDYGTLNGQQLFGLGAANNGTSSSPSMWWKWAAIAGGIGVIGFGFWWIVRSSPRGRGTGLGAVHETKLKLYETRVPSAKPSK